MTGFSPLLKKLVCCVWPAVALLLFVATGASAEEKIVTMESTITGSQEQPKVMYIVPWQEPQPAEGLNRPITRGLVENQILRPLDRDVFKREVRYYDKLNSMAQQHTP